MRKSIIPFFAAVLLLLAPGSVFAHATPVEIHPRSGEQLLTPPEEISIRFSERLEEGSSRIRLETTGGEKIGAEDALVDVVNPHRLLLPLETLPERTYIVSWSVVSADDGHFTKGSYAFAVGTSSGAIPQSAEVAVVQIASWGEVFAMFIEFLGNSLLWGALVLFAFVLRPLLRTSPRVSLLGRLYKGGVYGGVFIGVLGGVLQLLWKTRELASLHEIGFPEALLLYVETSAGSATLMRMGVLLLLAVLFVFLSRRVMSAERFGLFDVLLFAPLILFAFFRGIISHATANPFYPELSVFVNMLHLVEKDLWFGILIALSALLATSARDILPRILGRVFTLLALNFIALSLTATYIIWLHLKEFGNITSSLWGEAFVKLLAVSLVLVLLRTYHVLAYRYRAALFGKGFPFTLGLELAAGALVVLYSSLVIITSPPLLDTGKVFTAKEQGIEISLLRSPSEDAMALVTVENIGGEPLVLLGEEDGGLRAPLSKRFEGGYVFPRELLARGEEIHVVAPGKEGYDAHASFAVSPEDFEEREGHGRSFDLFTLLMIIIGILTALFAFLLYRLGKKESVIEVPRRSMPPLVIGVLLGLLLSYEIAAGAGALLGNPFKAACLRDGNMWHLMQPAKGGAATSATAREGCMLQGGQYHFADSREYEYLRHLSPAEVSFAAPERIRAEVPTKLEFTLREKDGTPAVLSVEHEKMLHVIVISGDMSSFSHVHPEDIGTADLADSKFSLEYAFPRAGEYIVAIDYLHGLTHESRQFRADVLSGAGQMSEPLLYESPQIMGPYRVSLSGQNLAAGKQSTLIYTIEKDGAPVLDLAPYLGAAMHVAVLKNDLSEFIHTHGEVHQPGVPPSAPGIHVHAPPPPRFGPSVEAHVTFPSPGTYTIFGEFKHGEEVIATHFSVMVE